MVVGAGGALERKKRERERNLEREAEQFSLITAYVLSIHFITLCAAHTYAKLIAQEVE